MATRDGCTLARIGMHMAHRVVRCMHVALAVSQAVARLREEDPKRHQQRKKDGWRARGSQVPHQAKDNVRLRRGERLGGITAASSRYLERATRPGQAPIAPRMV